MKVRRLKSYDGIILREGAAGVRIKADESHAGLFVLGFAQQNYAGTIHEAAAPVCVRRACFFAFRADQLSIGEVVYFCHIYSPRILSNVFKFSVS